MEHVVVNHWNGSVWKAILSCRRTMENISLCTIDIDEGIGVIKPNGRQKLLKCADKDVNFNFLCKRRKEILNLVTIEEWKRAENNK